MRRFAKASFAGSNLGSGIRRGRIGLVCLFVLGLAAFLGSSAPSAGAQACPNEGFRSGPSAHLPDCRAYEMVSPPEKEGYEVDDQLRANLAPAPTASLDGNTVLWSVERGAFGEPPSNGPTSDFLSRRGANWSSEAISPPISPSGLAILQATFPYGLTLDMSKLVVKGAPKPPLTPGASENTSNLYIQDLPGGPYRLLTPGLAPGLGLEPEYNLGGISANAGHVVFESEYELTGGCGGPSNEQLCDWNAATGALSPVGVLPGGGISTGPVTIAGEQYRRPLSTDGSRVFFHEGGGGECGVCVRINGTTTQLVSETGSFQFASSDGSVAYVTDGGDLLRWDGGLTNLTGGGGEVQGVLGASADGSRVYFVARKELAPGATAGENNLYLWTQGLGFQYIAGPVTLTSNWNNSGTGRTSRVTPDGGNLAFTANNSLTGFPDNGKTEAYLYNAATGALVCASCVVVEPANGANIIGGTNSWSHLSRNLSDDGGRLFFTTDEALVPGDVNGVNDVYEYDAVGGAVGLISSGTDARPAYFGDASPAGTDALFVTREQLVPLDTDTALDAYDARVGGGLASQHPAPPEPPCTGKGCRGESSSPDFAAPASAVVVGRGNVSQKQNCSKLGREAKKLSNRAKKLRRHAKQAKRNGKSKVAKKRNKKATRLAKRARNKSKSAKRCRKANRRASK